MAGKNKAKTWPEVVFAKSQAMVELTKVVEMIRNKRKLLSLLAVDNHRFYFYQEKAKSDEILMALKELAEVLLKS